MSFFGKLKTSVLSGGPPAPPRRTDDMTARGWPEDEFDEEDVDTYEAPPCERPVVKVPSRASESVYLDCPDRNLKPASGRRQAAPPPRPVRLSPETSTLTSHGSSRDQDHHHGNPPEVRRTDKPGKRPPLRPPSEPRDEDVYLDPNDGQEDDTYLEAVTGQCGASGLSRAPRDPPTPMLKPPLPRTKPSAPQSSDAPLREVRRPSVSSAPPLPLVHTKEAKLSSPPPPCLDSSALSAGGKSLAPSSAQDEVWFAGECERKMAEEALLRLNKDGAFLVRCSSCQKERQPFTLVVFYQQNVYNIPVRFLSLTHSYVLGKEGNKSSELFSSLQEMVSHHRKNPIMLIDRKSQEKHSTCLTHSARP